jgi:hypothetical protein
MFGQASVGPDPLDAPWSDSATVTLGLVTMAGLLGVELAMAGSE